MLVYVLNKNRQPLMPCNSAKARKLLKQNKAKVLRTEPFTIQLLYGSSGYKQNITLGVDAGSKHIGLSATTSTNELYAADIELRNDIVDLLSTRRQYRRTRRNRKTRYRKPKFLNRVKSKNKGWLAPSIENKIHTHFKAVKNTYKILPITNVIVETASFDITKEIIPLYLPVRISNFNSLLPLRTPSYSSSASVVSETTAKTRAVSNSIPEVSVIS